MTEWLDDLRLEPGPPFLAMGTHSLNLDQWLVVDADYELDVAYKRELLSAKRSVVFDAMPGAEDACGELLDNVRDWLSSRGIAMPERTEDEHPLIEAAALVQEDLAVLQNIDGAWILTAGAICFPTHWCIADKIGLPLSGVHEPVAHYENDLRKKVDRFHDRLSADRPVWRRNWIVTPTRELHLPDRGGPEEVGAPNTKIVIEADGSPMWIRSERQTLRRLARTGAIVFTIRIQRVPLGVLLQRRDLAGRMLAATSSWDAKKRMYASTGGALDQLNEWLARVADQSGG
jgi:hypothetical protein